MSQRPPATADRHQHQTARGYFARLTSARCMLLTTIELDGTFVSAPVHGVVDGDRAYVRAWGRSGIVKRLEHADAVQVTPCSVLGMCSYPPPLDVDVRPLPAEEARRVAGKLARKYPVQHRFWIRLLHQTCRWPMVYYELLALDAPEENEPAGPATLGQAHGELTEGDRRLRRDRPRRVTDGFLPAGPIGDASP